MPRSFSAVNIHVVFSTKDRRPFLADRESRLEVHNYLGGVAKHLGCQPLMVGGVSDHVHMLTGLGKTISQAEFVKEVKRVSSGWIKERDPYLHDFSWQGGYGAFSVDMSNLERIRQYIVRQEQHH